jgi:dephospho-CoA kinase
MTYLVGLSGGIGSGKSTVANLFRELGIKVIDTDEIAHRLTGAGGEAIPQLQEAFGAACLDPAGAMDRAWMRRLVFSDAAARRKLEAILHPLIFARALEETEDGDGSPYLLLVVPLLFESTGFRKVVNRTVIVDCSEERQIERTMARSGLARDEVLAIMAGQASRAERRQLADDIIQNDHGTEDLRPQVARLHQLYLDRSSGAGPAHS